MNVLEPSADKVHYPPAPLQDAVTLCGITDWLGHEHKGDGALTGKPVTCKLCKSIMNYQTHYRDVFALDSENHNE